MALVDANYNFIYVDVGAQGRISDAGVFNNCSLSEKLERNTMNVPVEEILPFSDLTCPYMVIADDAFPLRSYIMKPFSRRGMNKGEIIFNYRLSRARRVVENAFGILANRFRVFRAPMFVNTSTAKKIVLACTALHNMLHIRDNQETEITTAAEYDDFPVETSDGLAPLRCPVRIGRHLDEAKVLRDKLAHYFLGAGRVEWQDRMVGLT